MKKAIGIVNISTLKLEMTESHVKCLQVLWVFFFLYDSEGLSAEIQSIIIFFLL